MKGRCCGAAVLVIMLGVSATARAGIHVTPSLEWMTVEAPLIVRGVVTEVHTTKGVFTEQPLWDVQDVTIAIHETLKGDHQQTVTLRWLNSTYESAEQWKTDGHERLFFLAHGERDYYGVDFTKEWVLYEGYPYVPVDLVTMTKAPVAADMTVPKTADQLLGRVRARLEQAASFTLPKRSVQREVPENSEAYKALWEGSACFLIVPAEEHP